MPNLLPVFSIAILLVNLSATPERLQFIPVKEAAVQSETTIRFLGEKEETDQVIPWKYERMLTWEDFQSQPKKGTDVVATTSTTLGISYQLLEGKLVYSITCNFSKVKSWGSLRTDYILAHEQGHFDITELIARKLHADLQAYEVNRKTFREDIAAIYHAAVKEKEDMQETYDHETDHSRNRQRQYEWLDQIEKMLTETEHLETYP